MYGSERKQKNLRHESGQGWGAGAAFLTVKPVLAQRDGLRTPRHPAPGLGAWGPGMAIGQEGWGAAEQRAQPRQQAEGTQEVEAHPLQRLRPEEPSRPRSKG